MTQLGTRPVRTTGAARICTIVAFVFAGLAVLIAPGFFGLAGLVLGIVAGVLGDRPLGWYAAGASVLGMVLGMLLAGAVYSMI